MRTCDFEQFRMVLERKRPDRPTLFEFALNGPLHRRLSGATEMGDCESPQWRKVAVQAFAAAGYDYVMLHASGFRFGRGDQGRLKSISQNEGGVIFDRESFNHYQWPDPGSFSYERLEQVAGDLPQGMKIIVYGPGGVLENCIALCGYENLAMMVLDDPALAGDVFDAVGARLLCYYQLAANYPMVGAMMSNDDWGFAQQTMLSPEHMRQYVIPWHRKIARAIHEAGMPALLHSCGNLTAVMDDIIDDIGYDAKHSYEDKILPVEEAYRKYGARIAILGGIDVDFVCRAGVPQIRERCRRMLQLAEAKGGYALGTGNSVPAYVPQENYLAMIQAANPQAKFVTA